MYILMIARGIPSAKDPQWGCFESEQATALADMGHKVIVACIDSRFRFSLRKVGMTHITKDNVEYYNYFLCPSAITDLISHQWTNRCLESQFHYLYQHIVQKHGKPDVIYGQFFFNTKLGVKVSIAHHIPLVGIEHAARFNEPTLNNWKYTMQDASYTYSHTHQTIAVSPNLQESLKRHFGVESVFLPNMAAKEFMYAAPTLHPLTFIATGSLIHRKGFDLLPKAFSGVKNLPDNWQMVIVGGGEEKNRLQHQIDQLGLTQHILLVGQKSKKEILPLLQQADAFILPSRNENFSVAVLEALACGVPVISSICGGIRECINEQNGLLFEVDDVEGLTKAIQTMVDQPDKFDHKAIAEDYQKRFSPEVIARQLTNIFEETIQKHHKSV